MYTILGATGHIGSVITDQLLAAGQQVRTVARNAEKLQHFADRGAEVFTADADDTAALTKAFEGSKAIFILLPPNPFAPDFKAFADKLSESIVTAVKNSGVKNVVALSSLGAHTEEKTGVVASLARHEKRLQQLEGVNILILRPTYFLENLLNNISMIKHMGINGSAQNGDLLFPVIATKDIGKVAADRLLKLDFTGISVLPLLGARDYTLKELTTIFGTAIGKPDLQYIQFPPEQTVAAIVQAGLSESYAKGLVELSLGMNDGVFVTERTAERTTPTTAEEFAATFAAAYNQN